MVVRRAAYKGFWQETENLRGFFDALAPVLGVQQLSDWYRIRGQDVKGKGGRGLFTHYTSLPEALQVAYPEFAWSREEFAAFHTPPGYWQDNKRLMEWIERAEHKLGIVKTEDWYSVAMTDLQEIGISSKINRTKLATLLGEKYPDFKWDKMFLLRGRYAEQKRLERVVASLFSGETIQTNVRKEGGLVDPKTGAYLELDIYLPSLGLAFEYQDIHHYKSTSYAYQPIETFRSKDITKRELAQAKGLTIISVPCWWDGTAESLISTIHKHRPDLLLQAVGSQPIPEDMPPGFLERNKHYVTVEGIGEPTTACFFTETNVDPTGWWLLEKYDGVRAFWNPTSKVFYSRRGNIFRNIPTEIIDAMPDDIFLDGELWFGRDRFEDAVKISRRANAEEIDWKAMKYMVFDAPAIKGSYKDRYAALENHQAFKKAIPFLEIAPKVECTGTDHLERFLQDMLDKGGEGIILRDPQEEYVPGRAKGYLKHKKFRDSEAQIIAKLGPSQWECELPNGVTFTAVPGTTEFVKRWSPVVGDIVSFKHKGFLLGSKKPLSPVLYRLRPDLTWTDVVNNWKEGKPRILHSGIKRRTSGQRERRKMGFAKAKLISYVPSPKEKTKPLEEKKKSYWKDAANCRKLFEEFAKVNRFDALNPDNWYAVNSTQLVQQQGAAAMMAQHRGWKNALQIAFPEIKFDESKWESPVENYTGYWKEENSKRLFFCELAEELGLNPLDIQTWVKVTKKQVVAKKGGWSVLHHSNRSLRAALQEAFPELSFDVVFSAKRPNWKNVKECREFFDKLAEEMRFYSLDPKNWHSLNLRTVYHAKKGARSLAHAHGGLRNALEFAYPELELHKGWE